MITKQDARKVVKKFELEERKGKHRFYKLIWNGQIVLTTAIPHGKGPFHCRDKFRNQLYLNEDQLADAVQCPFTLAHWIAHLKVIGRIQDNR